MNEDTPPGYANLPIGAGASNDAGKNANPANQEIGGPREDNPREEPYWHSRGYLPHFEDAEKIQHVTFHLADSLPKAALARIEAELRGLPTDSQDVERRKRLEAWVDAGHGACVLREPAIAQMTQKALLFFDDQRYRLLAWVVMPNHVHTLFQPVPGWTVAKIVASWKKFTARKICDYQKAKNTGDAPGTPDPVWHREYWDRFIRNEKHLHQAIAYIHQNPVKAGLAATAEGWRWSSAFSGANTAKANHGPTNQEIGEPRGVASPATANQEIGGPRREDYERS